MASHSYTCECYHAGPFRIAGRSTSSTSAARALRAFLCGGVGSFGLSCRPACVEAPASCPCQVLATAVARLVKPPLHVDVSLVSGSAQRFSAKVCRLCCSHRALCESRCLFRTAPRGDSAVGIERQHSCTSHVSPAQSQAPHVCMYMFEYIPLLVQGVLPPLRTFSYEAPQVYSVTRVHTLSGTMVVGRIMVGWHADVERT